MGLAERRLAEQIKTEEFPTFLADLQAAMGFAPDLDIDWASFTAYNQYPLTRMKSNVLESLVDAMKTVGKDDMGKEALAESVQKIAVKNVPTRSDVDMSLSDKTLHLLVSLTEDEYSSCNASDIASFLEAKL